MIEEHCELAERQHQQSSSSCDFKSVTSEFQKMVAKQVDAKVVQIQTIQLKPTSDNQEITVINSAEISEKDQKISEILKKISRLETEANSKILHELLYALFLEDPTQLSVSQL